MQIRSEVWNVLLDDKNWNHIELTIDKTYICCLTHLKSSDNCCYRFGSAAGVLSRTPVCGQLVSGFTSVLLLIVVFGESGVDKWLKIA